MKSITVLFLLISLWPTLSGAGSRCDCSPSKRSGTCLSTIDMVSNRIKITSDTPACSMVTWYANGNPNVTIVTDRVSSEEWLGSGNSSLEIGSCSICFDRVVLNTNQNDSSNDREIRIDFAKCEKYKGHEMKAMQLYSKGAISKVEHDIIRQKAKEYCGL